MFSTYNNKLPININLTMTLRKCKERVGDLFNIQINENCSIVFWEFCIIFINGIYHHRIVMTIKIMLNSLNVEG